MNSNVQQTYPVSLETIHICYIKYAKILLLNSPMSYVSTALVASCFKKYKEAAHFW